MMSYCPLLFRVIYFCALGGVCTLLAETEPASVEASEPVETTELSSETPAVADTPTSEPPRSRWATENAAVRTHFALPKGAPEQRAMTAYVVPIEGPISKPQLFILRRGIKEAIRNDIDLIVLDINTPGGELGTMLEMMDALDKFPGAVLTYVNDEAISAGSFIAVATDEIYFSPKGMMGASEAITSTGEDINEGMKRKLESYLDAKVRTLTRSHRYRSDVQRAMMKPDFEFKIGDEVISPAGELLTLTADQAVKAYGEPPEPLLAQAIVESVDELLELRHGKHEHVVRVLELSWSEHLAKFISSISPILMGLGLMLLFIEFKTPGFGIFGISGIVLIAIVFAGNYVAGLAGQEIFLFFGLGILLLAVELFIIPGTLVAGMLGVLLIFGSLLWSLMDVWPGETPKEWHFGGFGDAVMQLVYAVLIAVAGLILLARVLPRSVFWNKFILSAQAGVTDADSAVVSGYQGRESLPPVGAKGIAVTPMYPSGEVEIGGKRYLARAEGKMLEEGTEIVVVEQNAFQLIVRES